MTEQYKHLITVVPDEPDPASGVVLTRGTKVMMGDAEVKGVTKVIITGEPNDVWRAEIHCMVNMKAMPGMLIDIERSYHSSWWRKSLVWLAQINIGRA
jgi:hypothetical protein